MTKQCNHEEFLCRGNVTRLTNEKSTKVVAYCVDFRVRCAQCGLAFLWRGLPQGMSTIGGAYTDPERVEARLVVEPGPPGLDLAQ